jgi:hypothetical protein
MNPRLLDMLQVRGKGFFLADGFRLLFRYDRIVVYSLA